MKRFSIKKQILIILILTSFFSIILIGGVSLNAGSKALKIETIEKTNYIIESMKNDFEKNILEAEKVLTILESVVYENLDAEQINDADYLNQFIENIRPVVQREAQNHNQSHTAYVYVNPFLLHDVFDVYYADQDFDGTVELQEEIPITYYEEGPTTKASKSWWFGPIEKKGPFWTEPYGWQLDNGNIIEFVSYTKPIYVGDKLFCIIGTDMTYDIIKNRLVSFNALQKGFSFLLDEQNQPIITRPGLEEWSKNNNFVEEAEQNRFAEIKTSQGKKLVFISQMANGWKIGIEIDEDQIYKALFDYMLLVISAMVVLQLIFVYLSIRFSNYIVDPILDIVGSVNQSHGMFYNIEIDTEILLRKDEVGILAQSLQKMSTELQNYIETIKKQSSKLVTEMTLRKDVQNQLLLIMKILEHSDNGIFIASEDLKVIYSNKTYADITGFDIVSNESDLEHCGIYLTSAQISQLNTYNSLQDEMEQLNCDGKAYPIQLYMTKIVDKDVYYLGIFKDLTENKIRDQRLNYLKYYDPLTKLPNKVLFVDTANKLIKNVATVSYECIMINIDNFRLLNGILGVETCNQIINMMSKRLESIELVHGLIGRTEGDEFALFYHLDEGVDKMSIVQYIRDYLSQPYIINDEEVYITISIGVSSYPEDGDQITTLLRNANIALSQVKANGKNFAMRYENAINQISAENYEILKAMRYALEKDEMFLFYQPQVDSITGEITGVETLLRWTHEGEQIPPSRFIPLAEESRMIISIGEYVIHNALLFAKHLQNQGIWITLSINVSVEQLKFDFVYKQIKYGIETMGIDPHFIEIEVTESIIITDQNEAVSVVSELKKLGIRIAIDDFGMGYSSLSYLKKFDFDRIKLDRIFIKDYPEKDDGYIATLIINLANSIGVEVVAEGMETEIQKDFLINQACKTMQGYYYSKPLSEAQCLVYIQEHYDFSRSKLLRN